MNTLFSKSIYKKLWICCSILLYATSTRANMRNIVKLDNHATITLDGYRSEYAYNLNVIYFVPADGDTIPGYCHRISTLLLWAQEYTKQEMARHGYPDKTFGLLVNNKQQVKMHVIRSQYHHSELPYEGNAGSNRAQHEVQAFYDNFPEEKHGQHTLIIYPSAMRSNGIQPLAGTPFYGVGKYGHALDYSLLTLENVQANGTIGNEARKWFGGMIHEMFHGLNLPHNSLTAFENGTPLMRFHYRLGKDPVILTAADAAILNVGQICSKTKGSFYTPSINSLSIDPFTYDPISGTIQVSGYFTATQAVNSIVVYIDPYEDRERKEGGPGNANTDYDAISFVVKPYNGTFKTVIPIAALKNFDTNIDHYIRINLLHENGLLSTNVSMSSFRFTRNKIPEINVNDTRLANKI
ncbi:hypothetical protein [Sphingobacterium sp. SYP-B4668]|uniref:hypothetical protein n=1 Tax=Sphingobacterium sp. SYP-B4668 TaxID=2996035 RepID=UPI0022DE46D8|nr:hypothetical protein [Sphingobacterium sp. SYP-B4668]